MIIPYMLATAGALAFSCVVEPPRNVHVNGDNATSAPIRLPPEINRWKFDLALRSKADRVDVTLDWPGDPILAGKALGAVPIGPHDFAFISVHPGPCVFTVSACMFMYTLSQQADGGADILIQPSAMTTEGDRSHPFQVFMKGRCTPKGASR